jgi:predicted dehydrogenase
LFSEAILNKTEVPTPLADSVYNMRVLDAVINSAKTDTWVTLSTAIPVG